MLLVYDKYYHYNHDTFMHMLKGGGCIRWKCYFVLTNNNLSFIAVTFSKVRDICQNLAEVPPTVIVPDISHSQSGPSSPRLLKDMTFIVLLHSLVDRYLMGGKLTGTRITAWLVYVEIPPHPGTSLGLKTADEDQRGTKRSFHCPLGWFRDHNAQSRRHCCHES